MFSPALCRCRAPPPLHQGRAARDAPPSMQRPLQLAGVRCRRAKGPADATVLAGAHDAARAKLSFCSTLRPRAPHPRVRAPRVSPARAGCDTRLGMLGAARSGGAAAEHRARTTALIALASILEKGEGKRTHAKDGSGPQSGRRPSAVAAGGGGGAADAALPPIVCAQSMSRSSLRCLPGSAPALRPRPRSWATFRWGGRSCKLSLAHSGAWQVGGRAGEQRGGPQQPGMCLHRLERCMRGGGGWQRSLARCTRETALPVARQATSCRATPSSRWAAGFGRP